MSNSLVIDVPNVVKQNTPLRNVPSGSTAEPDYSVKYVPQTLTEEQKAQARANIGAPESLELTMTDEDGNVITGTFVLTSKSITPAS